MFAGPGAGKTTCAWAVAAELKKAGYVTEYVPEYAKELVWDKQFDLLDGTPEHQRAIFAEQAHRLERLNGQVDFIVTDSPLMLNLLYLRIDPEQYQQYADMVYGEFSQYTNFSVFVERGETFEQAGRIHNLSESIALDNRIKDIMEEYHIYHGSYTYKTAKYIAGNCIKTYQRVNKAAEQEAGTLPQNIATTGRNVESEKYEPPSQNIPEKEYASLDEYADLFDSPPLPHSISMDEAAEYLPPENDDFCL